jgi:hypothetical protein
MSEDTVFTPRATQYVAAMEERLRSRAPREIAARIDELVVDHDGWRERSLNMPPRRYSRGVVVACSTATWRHA